MQLFKPYEHVRICTGMQAAVFLTLACFLQVPAFPMEMWEQLLKEQLEEARNGDSDAQYNVGIKYLKGQGVKQDPVQARRWLQQADDAGHEGAKDKLERLENQQKAFTALLDKAQKTADPDAQYQVGIMYLKGKGTVMDGSQARSWIGKAAQQGEVKAITRLGILYYKGEGGKTDYAHALQLFNSVSSNSVLAQYYLGEMYAEGRGVDKNHGTAIDWYRKAADGGFTRAGGKIINMQEEIKMDERRRINLARRKQSVEAAQAQLAAEKPPAKTKPQGDATRLAKATKPVVKRPKKPVVKKTAAPAPLEKLAGTRWERNRKQVEYLPSNVTDCEIEPGKLVCLSGLMTRTSGTSTVHYRVKSEVTSTQDVFHITYRNLVIDVIGIERDDEELSAYGDEADQGFHIKTGWTQDHKVECKSVQAGKLDCIKDQTHKMTFVGK